MPLSRPVNCHIHLPPNSSAFATVKDAVEQAANEGLVALGASNYYDFTTFNEFEKLAARYGIIPLFGVEIIVLLDDLLKANVRLNDPANPGKMYICGKGITQFKNPSRRAKKILDEIRGRDASRMKRMIEKLNAVFARAGINSQLDENSIIVQVMKRHDCTRESVTLQERHVAAAFQEAFFANVPDRDRRTALTSITNQPYFNDEIEAVAVQHELRMALMKRGRPAFVEEEFVSFDEAWTLICELGGIPCYPLLADGVDPIPEFERTAEELIDNLKSLNIHWAEFMTTRNSRALMLDYVPKMRQAGIVVTAGTEHNTHAKAPLTPQASDGKIPNEVNEIFQEGACVLAAHQSFLTTEKVGYVDSSGNLNNNFKSFEERISYFSKIGHAIIQNC